jgi:hypothetical protein
LVRGTVLAVKGLEGRVISSYASYYEDVNDVWMVDTKVSILDTPPEIFK